MLPQLLLVFASALTLTSALRPTRLIYEYPEVGTFLENIAARSDGSLLLTSVGKPGGLSLLRPDTKGAPVQLLKNFPHNATLGIVETGHDVFHFIASNFSLMPPVGTVPGTNTIWRYSFKQGLEHVLSIPDAEFLNGLTKFNDTLLLAADSKKGAVWTIDLKSPKAHVLVQDPLMMPPSGDFEEGINGLHLYGRQLYFTNSQRFLYAVLDLDAHAQPQGPAKLVARSLQEKGVSIDWDDFSLDSHGTAYLATEIGNTIQSVSREGHVKIVAGNINSTAILEPSSTVFGRGPTDQHTLYVTTAGGVGFPAYVNGIPRRVGAQVVAVDL